MKNQIQRISLTIIFLGFIFAALISCEGPEGPQGEDGNANVTRYIFDGTDFTAQSSYLLEFDGITQEEFENSIWITYLVLDFGDGIDAFMVPGEGVQAQSLYRTIFSSYDDGTHIISIILVEGAGEIYHNVYVFQIPGDSEIDVTSKSLPDILPSNIDLSDYHAVTDHFDDGMKTIRN